MDYDKDPFLVLRFWFWVCECVDSPGKEIIVLRWKMKPLCVCVWLWSHVQRVQHLIWRFSATSHLSLSLSLIICRNSQQALRTSLFPLLNCLVGISADSQSWAALVLCLFSFFYLTFVNRPLKRRTIKHKDFNRVLNRLHLFVATRKILTPPPPIPPSSLIMPVPLHLPVLVECTHAWWSELDRHSEGIGNRAVSMCMHACGK